MPTRQRQKQRPGRRHWVYKIDYRRVSQVRPFLPPVQAAPGDQILFVGDIGLWGIGHFNAMSPRDLRHPERASLLQVELTFVNQGDGKQLSWNAARQRLAGPVARNVQQRVHTSETDMIMVMPGEWRALAKMLGAIPQPPLRTSAPSTRPTGASLPGTSLPVSPTTTAREVTDRPRHTPDKPSEPRGEHRYWITTDSTNDSGVMVRLLTYPGGEVRPGDPVVLVSVKGHAKLAEVTSVAAAGANRSKRSLRVTITAVTHTTALRTEVLVPFKGNVNGRLAELTESEWHSLTEQNSPVIGQNYLTAEAISVENAREIASLFTSEKLIKSSNRHRRLQNTLANLLTAAGLHPRSPSPDTPLFDLTYDVGTTTIVVEVKSLSDDNEAHQLRTGLGQVLYYAELLRSRATEVQAVLFVERAPSETIWIDVCGRAGVLLAWPTSLDQMPGLARTRWPNEAQKRSRLRSTT
ncbi:hypothetical protein ACIRG5_21680 [Lentzea sp. NPDC102401]|uniref:hypothetical protein n=1 Tax=Lentzea sp. NPDC102401 TaxID=3364128 RepID=UPI00380F5A62